MKRIGYLMQIFIILFYHPPFTTFNIRATKVYAVELSNPQGDESADTIRKFSEKINAKDYESALVARWINSRSYSVKPCPHATLKI